MFCLAAMAHEDVSANDAVAESTEAENTEVFSGYEDLPWGASLKDVKKKYPGLTNKTSKQDKKIGLTYYSTSPKLLTKKPGKWFTQFMFLNDRLCHVGIVYNNFRDENITALLDALAEKYGKPTSMSNNGAEWVFSASNLQISCGDTGRNDGTVEVLYFDIKVCNKVGDLRRAANKDNVKL